MSDPIAKVAIPRVDRRPTRGWDIDKTRAPRACLSCRARKVKCTGEIPSCQRCSESGQQCVYRQRRNGRQTTAPEPPDRHMRALMDSLRDRVAEDDRRQLEDLLEEFPNTQATLYASPTLLPAEDQNERTAEGKDDDATQQVRRPTEPLYNEEISASIDDAASLVGTQDWIHVAQNNMPITEKVMHASSVVDAGPDWSRSWSSTAPDGPEHIQMDNSTLLQLCWYLQTNSSKDARKFLDSVRPPRSERPARRGFGDPSEESVPMFSPPQPLPRVSANDIRVIGAMPRAMTVQESHRSVAKSTAPLLPSLLPAQNFARDTTVATIKIAVDIFFKSSCLLFYIISKEQVEAILVGDFQRPDDTPFVDILRTCSTLEARARLAELCGMAAVGLLFLRGSDNHVDPPAGLSDYFYNLAKQLLDNAIEVNPFRAMKVCALLCMYNIYVHARVAVAFVEFGLGLAKTFDLTHQYPSRLSLEEYLDYRRTWRTLLCFSGWLAASLGYAPGQASTTMFLLHDDTEGREEDIIQRELVKITIIKAKMLCSISDGEPVHDDTIEAFRQELKHFEANLPSWMKVASLLDRKQNFPQRRVAMYFHLYFLSAMQLLYRMPMSNCLQLSLLPTRPTAQAAMEEGLIAAELGARLYNVMRSEGLIVKICWMCIYCAYSTGTILLQKAIQKMIHGHPSSSWIKDLTLAKVCVDTLLFCGEKDKVAAGLNGTLARYLDVIEAAADQAPSAPFARGEVVQGDASIDYILAVPLGGSTLHKAARDLLRLIQYPFDTNLEVLPQSPPQAHPLRYDPVDIIREAVEIPQERNVDLGTCGIPSDNGDRGEGSDSQIRNVIQDMDPGRFVDVGNGYPWPLWTPQEV